MVLYVLWSILTEVNKLILKLRDQYLAFWSNTNQKVPFHQLKNVLIRFSLQVVNAHVGNLLIDLRSCLASIALFSRLKDLYLFTHSTKYLITTLDIELQVLSAPYLQSTPAANLQVRIK